jgi:lipid A disaccharide synthetase
MQNDIANSNLMSLFLLTILALICVLQNGQEKSIPTHYYISPQIWAWKKIASLTSKDVDKMYVILPFEKHFMKTNIIFGRVCGSPSNRCDTQPPIVDSTKFRIENQLDDKPIIALLPGQEARNNQNACGDVKYCRRFS